MSTQEDIDLYAEEESNNTNPPQSDEITEENTRSEPIHTIAQPNQLHNNKNNQQNTNTIKQLTTLIIKELTWVKKDREHT
jgi:hypothetical protein